MKILFYINNIKHGGAERVMVNLIDQLINRGNEIVLVTTYFTEGEFECNLKAKRKIILKNVDKGLLKRNIKILKELKKIIIEENPDICISFLAEPNIRLLLATIGLKTKTIISIRNDPNREYCNFLLRLIAKSLFVRADGIVFQTKDAQKWFSKRIQLKSEIIMNQVSESFFNIERETGEYYVATGRLNYQKNYPLLINAFTKFVKNNNNKPILYIYGEGPLKEELQHLINTNKMNSNIFLKGVTNDVQNVLKKSKGFILSSLYEGMPNGLLEAMAVGLPCISTDCPCGGPKELIENGRNGILIEVNDEKGLIEALTKVEKNKEFAEIIGSNARICAKNYSPESIISKWFDYMEMVKNRG